MSEPIVAELAETSPRVYFLRRAIDYFSGDACDRALKIADNPSFPKLENQLEMELVSIQLLVNALQDLRAEAIQAAAKGVSHE